MSTESKMTFRIYAFSALAFIVLALIVGFVYAILIALLAFLLWKIYSYSKLMRWWKGEPFVSRQIIDFVTERLNEGTKSKNLWIQSLTTPEVAEFDRNYRVELMARPMIIEKGSSNVIEGWTEWGATRLEENVPTHSVEELGENVGNKENPLPMLKLMIAKAAFEILIAEHALALLNVPNPRKVVSQRTLSKELEKLNLLDAYLRPPNAEKSATVLKLLAEEIGEAAPQAN